MPTEDVQKVSLCYCGNLFSCLCLLNFQLLESAVNYTYIYSAGLKITRLERQRSQAQLEALNG